MEGNGPSQMIPSAYLPALGIGGTVTWPGSTGERGWRAGPHNGAHVVLSHMVPGMAYAELKAPGVEGSVPERKIRGPR